MFTTSVSRMQVWAYVLEYVRANLHACKQMSWYAYVLISYIYIDQAKLLGNYYLLPSSITSAICL